MSGDSLVGRVLGGAFEITETLGEGGFGAVYVARHTRTRRRYAVKVLRSERGSSGDAARRFRREADSLAALGHPGIVSIHDFATTEDGIDYLVMDLLEGEDLASYLARTGRLPLNEALDLAGQVGAALGAAHGAGIVHRDLKPANIFLVQAAGMPVRPMILDFGLAKMLDEATPERLTASGVAMGTPQYMSPEQASGSAIDHRTDIYALASIAYEMIAGVPPFEAPTISALMVKILTAPPPLLSTRIDVPVHVDAALARALLKEPEERFHDVGSFIAGLRGIRGSIADTRIERAAQPVPATRELSARTPEALAAVATPEGYTVPVAPGAGVTPVGAPTRSGVRRLAVAGAVAIVALAVVIGGSVWAVSRLRMEATDAIGQPDEIAAVEVSVAPADPRTEESAPPEAPEPEPAPTVDDAIPTDVVEAPVAPVEGRHRSGPRDIRPAAPPAPAPSAALPSAPSAAAAAPSGPAASLPASVIASYRATIDTYEPQVREIDAYIARLPRLRSAVDGLAEGHEPALCQAAVRGSVATNSHVPIVVSTSQQLDREIERVCAPFERHRNPPEEVRRILQDLPSTLDRAEAMTRETHSSNQPTEIADQVRDAVVEARRVTDGVEAGRRPFPCDAAVWSRLRRLTNAGNGYSGAAAERVVRVRDNACSRIGIDPDQLQRAERQFRDQLDTMEGTMRQVQRSFQQIIDQYRAYVP